MISIMINFFLIIIFRIIKKEMTIRIQTIEMNSLQEYVFII
jgi:hypothetical protein